MDLRAMTARQQAAWVTGDFSQLARQVVRASEDLCEALDPRPNQRLLDVACGSGNASLAAARRYCQVTGIDFVPAQIDYARRRAAVEHCEIDFQVQDAQALSFLDASFDLVVSVFGVMFAPDQAKAAAEMMRVCRRGGKIGVANPTPEGLGGDFFKVHAKYLPMSEGLMPAGRWGTEEGLAELFGEGVEWQARRRRRLYMYFRTVEEGVEAFGRHFGPTSRALAYVEGREQERLRRELRVVFERYNRAADGTAVLECEYLEVVALRR
jgi:ubiquinone/menaquinone biosynthesis C-methylase UbiE